MSAQTNPSEWIRLAEMDSATAHHMFETYHPKPIEIVCFHAQQAAEKMLKAFLVSKGIDFPKTHDLQELCLLCEGLDIQFNNFHREMVTLNRYSVIPRYPMEWEITEADAETALKCSENIMNFTKKIMLID